MIMGCYALLQEYVCKEHFSIIYHRSYFYDNSWNRPRLRHRWLGSS